jgi:tyrosyl-tRNA synthetase
MNNKMGGDLKKIQVVGRYMVEIWKAVGMNMERVEFLSCSGGMGGWVLHLCLLWQVGLGGDGG